MIKINRSRCRQESRYFFAFEIDQSQWAIALLTVNKHWAALVFHGYTLIVS